MVSEYAKRMARGMWYTDKEIAEAEKIADRIIDVTDAMLEKAKLLRENGGKMH